jgi:hypothetical protein
MRLRPAWLVVALLGLALLGARPSAEDVLAGEPPALVEQLLGEGTVLLDDAGEGTESFVVAYVVFERSLEDVLDLLRQAERQTEYRPELRAVRTVADLPDGRVDEHRLRILFKNLTYRLRYREEDGGAHLSWSLDEGYENDIRRLDGFWDLYTFDRSAARTLGRFGSNVDVGAGVPRFIQEGMSRKTVVRYIENCRRWVDSDGRWRP